MNTVARNFDRLAYIDTLKEGGINEAAARAHANALDAAMRDGLATKQDIQSIYTRFDGIDRRFEAMDAKIDAVEARLDAKTDAVEGRLDAKIDLVEARLRGEIWQSSNRVIVWLGGTMIALSGIVLAVVKFTH
jgi:hypothetical protein